MRKPLPKNKQLRYDSTRRFSRRDPTLSPGRWRSRNFTNLWVSEAPKRAPISRRIARDALWMLTGTGNFYVFFATLKLGLLTGDAVIRSTGATDDISKSRLLHLHISQVQYFCLANLKGNPGNPSKALTWICLRLFFYRLYHGKSPSSHHLGDYCLLVPRILSKSKLTNWVDCGVWLV